jgi:hypothetical protein
MTWQDFQEGKKPPFRFRRICRKVSSGLAENPVVIERALASRNFTIVHGIKF